MKYGAAVGYDCRVKHGNLLTEQHATFIVNASNTKLLLGSGVSMAFKRHCGKVLQDEMSQKFQQIGTLHKGDVVATSSGDAKKFKYALHAAVMDYNQGVKAHKKNPTYDDIVTILQNIESYVLWYIQTHPHEVPKVVLPLLGCGVGGLNTEKVIQLYKTFFCRDVSFLCDIIMYGHSVQDYEALQNTFHFSGDNNEFYNKTR